MASTSGSLANDNEDSSLQHQSKQRIVSPSTQRRVETPDRFVFPQRGGPNQDSSQLGQQYGTTNYQRANNNNMEFDLLTHLSHDFSDLLNRSYYSDCLLKVGGKLYLT